eukprot:4643781-Amphidinium_carterae.1
MEKAEKEGLRAISLDGKLVDSVSIKQAHAMVARADAIADVSPYALLTTGNIENSGAQCF